jgi:hypothetical protein
VLICPGCQAAVDWTSDLDRCEICSSIHLVRRLGEAECRDCGWVGQPAAAATVEAATARGLNDGTLTQDAAESLAEEVERALSRVLGTSSPRPPYAMS